MDKTHWTSQDIRKVFRYDDRYGSIQTLYNAEEKNKIPKASRVKRGKVNVRQWSLEQVPEIGKQFGFLPLDDKQHILCKYIQKGGVLKTTTSFNEAKTFALNGMKTLIIGLDFECSITDILTPQKDIIKLNNRPVTLGLFHFLAEKASLNEIIKHTPLPTLDIIPETHDLVALDKWLNQQKRREYVFRDKLIPLLQEYDVIIFDNGPSWNHLIENAIVSSDVIISPLGCNLLAYNASETNLSTLFEFQKVMELNEQQLIMFATLLERSSLSQQIYAQYLERFDSFIIPTPIRASVKSQEALLNKETILEYAPTSPQADEYCELIKMIWKIITTKKSVNELLSEAA